MTLDRRSFLSLAVVTGAGAASQASASPTSDSQADEEHVGCLVDTTLCIGCRQCEEACQRRNDLPRPERSFRDKDVFRTKRRPTVDAFTVVNEYAKAPSPDQVDRPSTYVKTQCMHCLDASCVSACIVGALSKAPDGAVIYNADVCIGCRYCMVACPFQVPAYEYADALTPRVRKCELCTDQQAGLGANPACAAACPTEAIVFGRRSDLLALARERIRRQPYRYVDHVYGETEVGGTGWLYLTGREHTELDLLELPDEAPPRLTEAIQHGIFRYAAIPIAVWGGLGALMWVNQRRALQGDAATGNAADGPIGREDAP